MTLDSKPIFVVGTPRSGTTLVARILGRHEAILAAGETHFFEEIWANRREFGPLENRSQLEAAVSRLMTIFDRYNQVEGQALVEKLIRPDNLINLTLKNGGGYDGLYWAFTSTLDDTQRGRRYCDDTPKHLFYLETIFKFFPESKVIVCIRDPRDFMCSYKNFWRTSRTPERIKQLYHPIMTAMLWARSADVILNSPILAQQSNNIVMLNYERLVSEPASYVRALCNFIDLDYEDDLLAVNSHNSSFEQGQAGIFRGSVGKWKDCLTPEEAWWIQTINRGSMRKMGYDKVHTSPSPIKLAAILFSAPAALFRILKANRGRRGPLLPYLMRRIFPANTTGKGVKSHRVNGLLE